MQPVPPCPAPDCWWWMQESGLLLQWELWLGTYSVGFFFFSFSPGYVALWGSKTPHRPTGERVSCCLETSPPSWLPPWDRSLSVTLLSLFLSFIFCPTSFQREWAAFLDAGVLCQHSEFVLWKLFSVQMVFWWICRGENGLPILFLCHLRTASCYGLFKRVWNMLQNCTTAFQARPFPSLLRIESLLLILNL